MMLPRTIVLLALLCLLVSAGAASGRIPHEQQENEVSRELKKADDDGDFNFVIPTVSPSTAGTTNDQKPTPAINPPTPVVAPPTAEIPTPARSAAPVAETPTAATNSETLSPTTEPEVTDRPTASKPAGEVPTISADTTESKAPTAAEVSETTAPTPAKDSIAPTPASTDAAQTSAPTFAKESVRPTPTPTTETKTGVPSAATPSPTTESPTTEATETSKPSIEKTERPVVQDTKAPTPAEDTGTTPVVTRTSVPTPVAVTEHPTFTPTQVSDTPAPSPVDAGVDNGGGDNTPADGDGTQDTTSPYSNSSFTLGMIVVGIIAVCVLYRKYCKAGAPAPTAGSPTAGNYARLPTSEESRGFLDTAGDIEMSGGVHSAAYDDNAEIWEEWETNEEVNPPPSILHTPAPSVSAPVRTTSSSSNGSGGGGLGSTAQGSAGNSALVKNSHSREDVPALTGNYRSASSGAALTANAAAGGSSPTVTQGTLGTLGTLGSSTGGSLGRLKAGNLGGSGSGGNLAGSNGSGAGARAGKSKLVNTPPPADVDLFASIGIAAAPKFGQQSGMGGFSNSSARNAPATRSSSGSGKAAANNGTSANNGSGKTSAGASRVSAVHMGSDYEGPGGTWDDDKELDDLIGDD